MVSSVGIRRSAIVLLDVTLTLSHWPLCCPFAHSLGHFVWIHSFLMEGQGWEWGWGTPGANGNGNAYHIGKALVTNLRKWELPTNSQGGLWSLWFVFKKLALDGSSESWISCSCLFIGSGWSACRRAYKCTRLAYNKSHLFVYLSWLLGVGHNIR